MERTIRRTVYGIILCCNSWPQFTDLIRIQSVFGNFGRIISPIRYRIIDAEYSKGLERIISISASPNQLHIYDPGIEQETVVNLPKAPVCVSVSPDGYYAAVGHDAWISYVDLRSSRFIVAIPVPADVFDIVLGEMDMHTLFLTPLLFCKSTVRCVDLNQLVGFGDSRQTASRRQSSLRYGCVY